MKSVLNTFLLLCSLVFLSQAGFAKSGDIPQVVAAGVEQQTLVQTIEALGTIKPSESVEVTATVTERVVSIHFEDGQFVDKGQVLVKLDSQELEATLQELKIATENTKQQYQRYLPLFRRGDVSQATLDEYKREWDLARAKEAVVEARLQKMTLSAPFSGQVGLRQISEGALLTPGTLVTSLQDMQHLKLDFSVPSRFFTEMAQGDQVLATSEAYPDKSFSAEIETILPSVDTTTRSIQVRAKLTNHQAQLLPGMLMKIAMQQTPKSVLFVPETAIIPVAENHFVYQLIADENGLFKVKRQQVVLGIRQPGLVQIVSGLNGGDKVISEGALRVRPGQIVKALEKIDRKSVFADEGNAQ